MDDKPAPSHADNNPQTAVVRYVGVPLIDKHVPILTPHNPGTSPSCLMSSVPQPNQAGPPTQDEADQGQVPKCGRAKSPPTPLCTPQYGHCHRVAVTPSQPEQGITPPSKPITWQEQVPQCGRAHPTTPRTQPSLSLSVATPPPPTQCQRLATTPPPPPAEQVQVPECGRAHPTTKPVPECGNITTTPACHIPNTPTTAPTTT